MKSFTRTFLVLLFLGTGMLCAQPTPPSNLSGSSLRSWLKTNWYNPYHSQLGYTAARRYMYNYIDNQSSKVTCVYGGYQKSWSYGGTGTNPWPINAEHTVPQSWFNSYEPMRSDLHHLFPCYSNLNSRRGSLPFAEIDDSQTESWWRGSSSQTSIPSSSTRDQYSEYASGKFEPREDHKGNVARAVFYFYTMYPTQAGSISQIGDLNTLYQWHLDDPVDSREIARNNAVANYQGNRNPYVSYPDLVARAWGFSGGGGGASQLIISEYVEGSSNNKAIEIANFTGSTVNLSGYSLRKQTNGSGSWSTGLSLSGNLANGAVYVVVNASAGSSLLNLADLTSGGSEMSFNGNDPVGLFYNGNLIDVVGNYNGGSAYFGAEVTLRRKSNVSSPRSSYLASEWDSFGQNTFSGLGSHTASSKRLAEGETEGPVLVWPNPFSDGFRVEGAQSIRVLDLQGRTVWEGQGGTVATGSWPSGIYLLEAQTAGGTRHQRLVKR